MKTRKLNSYYYKRGELIALRCSECGKLFHTPPVVQAVGPSTEVVQAFESHGCFSAAR